MNKNIKKVLIAAIATSAIFGGGNLTSHADALDSDTIKDNVVSKDEVSNDVEQVQELSDKDTSEVLREDKDTPKENKEISEDKEDKDDTEVTEEDNKLKENNENRGTQEDNSKENKENINEIKNDDKKDEDSLELSKETPIEKVSEEEPKEVKDNKISVVNGKNIINNFQIDDIKFTQTGSNKPAYCDEGPYDIKFSVSTVGPVKNGEYIEFNGFYPKLYNLKTKETYEITTVPFTSKSWDRGYEGDVYANINGKNVLIGKMTSNRVTFNENVENINNFSFDVRLGIASFFRLNVEKEGRKEFYDVPFYLTVNETKLTQPYTMRIRPHDRTKRVLTEFNYTVLRIEDFAKENDPFLMSVFDNPWGILAKVRDDSTWKDADIKIKITLPKGMVWDRSKGKILTAPDGTSYSNEKEIVLADNHDINRHYKFSSDMIKGKQSTKLSDTELMHVIELKEKPFAYEEGSYDYLNTGIQAEILDKSLINFKTGKLKAPIKFEYYLNGKLVQTIEKDDFYTLFSTSGAGGDALTKTETVVDNATTTYKLNKDLSFNEQKVIIKAIDGEKEIISTGKINDDGSISYTTTEKVKTERQDGLVEVGNIEIKEDETYYDIIEKEDPTLEKGKTKIQTKGVVGKKTTRITYEVDSKTGELINPKEEVLEDTKPVDEVVLVGTKDAESIPYEVEYRENKNEKTDYRKVIQQGEEGIKENGKVIKEPKNEIIEIGVIDKVVPNVVIDNMVSIEVQKSKDGEIGVFKDPRNYKEAVKNTETTYYKKLDTTTGEFIEGEDYSVITRNDSTEKINGLRTLNYKGTISNWTDHYFDEPKTGNKEMKLDTRLPDSLIKDPKFLKDYDLTTDKYVYKKAKTIYKANSDLKYNEKKEVSKAKDSMAYEEINFMTKTYKEVVDNELVNGITEVGNKKVEVKTKDGVTITTTTVWDVDPNTGELINPKVTVTKSSKWGTIEDIATKTEEKDTNYDTIYIPKPDLDFEKTEVVQKGVKGKKKVVTKGSEKPVETVLEKPKTEIIGVGNKKVVEEDIKVEGKDANKVTTTIYEVDKKTGKLINPKSTSKITLKAEEIEDISTKVTKKEESIKFKTTYEADSTLEYGKTKVKVKGKDGKKEITFTTKSGKSKVSEKVVEKPFDEVILVGNKKVETEDIEENGLKGIKTTTTISEVDKNTGKLVNTKVTVNKSLKAGVLEDNATTTKTNKEEIKGKTFYEADDSLEFGKQVVVKKTVDGEKEVTSKTVGGKTTKTEKILKEAEDGLVKVGNKKVEVETKDGITITTTTVYKVDKETGKLINPKVNKTTKMGTIEDIAKPSKKEENNNSQDNEKDNKEQKQGEKKAFIVAEGANTNNKLPSSGVQTGVAGVDYAIVGALLSSIGLGITSKKKKK